MRAYTRRSVWATNAARCDPVAFRRFKFGRDRPSPDQSGGRRQRRHALTDDDDAREYAKERGSSVLAHLRPTGCPLQRAPRPRQQPRPVSYCTHANPMSSHNLPASAAPSHLRPNTHAAPHRTTAHTAAALSNRRGCRRRQRPSRPSRRHRPRGRRRSRVKRRRRPPSPCPCP